MRVIGIYRKCDLVTLLGTCFALAGIILVVNGYIIYPIFALICAAICDAFDGVVARRFRSLKEEEIYGVELDSLSDVISFGILPMLIVLKTSPANVFTYASCIFFSVCGVIRLAYFNMLTNTKRKEKKEFIGLPITSSAIIIPSIYLLSKMLSSNSKHFLIFPPSVALLITGILFILPFRLKKLTTREKLIFSLMGVIAIILTLIKMYI